MPNHLLKRISVAFIAFLLIIGNFTTVSAVENTLPSKKQLQEKPVLETDKLSETDDPATEIGVIHYTENAVTTQAAKLKATKYDDLDTGKKENMDKTAKAKTEFVKHSMEKEKVYTNHLPAITSVVNGFSAEIK